MYNSVMNNCILIIILLVRLGRTVQYHNISIPKNGFGPYYAQIQSIYECNYTGPVHKSIKDSYRLERKVYNEFKEEFTWYWTADKDYRLVKGSTIGEIWKNGGFQIFLNKTSEEPCAYKSFKYFINQIDLEQLKMKECIIPRGNYSTSKINPNVYAHTYLGSKFFYGKTKTKIAFYSEIGLTFCLHVETILLPISIERKTKKNLKISS